MNRRKGKGLLELAKIYNHRAELSRKSAIAFAEALTEILSRWIPDLEWSLHWQDYIFAAICLWSDSRDVSHRTSERSVHLEKVLDSWLQRNGLAEIFVETPFGIFISAQEAREIEAALDQEGQEEEGDGQLVGRKRIQLSRELLDLMNRATF